MTQRGQKVHRRMALQATIIGSSALAATALSLFSVQAQTVPDTTANVAVVRTLYGLYLSADVREFDDVFAPDFVDHPPTAVPSSFQGSPRDAYKASVLSFRAALANGQVTVDDIIAADDKVVARWSLVATHVGPLAGVPSTGKQVQFRAVDIHRMANSVIAETWHLEDYFGLFTQIGFPQP